MRLLYDVLENTVKRLPAKTALIEPNGGKVTFEQLHEKCIAMEDGLRTLGVQKGSRVGIYSKKSIESIAALLGVSRFGGSYVPMDINAPANRNHLIIQDCQLTTLIVDIDQGPDLLNVLDGDWLLEQLPGWETLALAVCRTSVSKPSIEYNDLAYILYTSGSTGQPKGVMISHENALSFIEWASSTFHFTDEDVFTSIAPLHFDLSIFDLFVSIKNGASLVLLDAKAVKNPLLLSSLFAEYRVSVIYATPSLLKIVLRYGKLERFDHYSIRQVFFAGEVFPIAPLRELQSRWPQARFYNLYGPTETNVCSWFEIPQIDTDRQQPYPIGKACSHCALKIGNPKISTSGYPEGDLWVKGKGVAIGYWNDEQRSKERFILDENDDRWYKTGDLVRAEAEGVYTFIGRMDRMVKRRGYRIELGEIETILNTYSGIKEVAVLANKEENEEMVITAFLKSDLPIPSLLSLKQFCLEKLPAYMVPDHFEVIEAIPYTSTHKVDYQKLGQL